MKRRLLTIGHSYCVSMNRRLAHELARVGGSKWDVTVAGPEYFRGDLRQIRMQAVAEEPCTLVPLPARWTNRVHVMTYGGRLRHVVGDRWDVIHAWEEPFVFAGAQIARHAPRSARLVCATFQNIDKQYPPPFSWIERYVMRRCAGWIAFGQLVEQTLQDRTGYRDRPRRVIPVGVDVDEFRPDTARQQTLLTTLEWAPVGPPVVGFVGRLVPEKGVQLLMDVLDAVEVPWRALIVGTGPLESTVRQWAGRHPNRVRLLTNVAHDGIPAVLNACDMLAVPSQTTPKWREQLGRVLLEAFASGVPVIASDSGEIPHVVGDAGRIVPESDMCAWRGALSELLESAAQRTDYAARGRERAERLFAWPVVARAHLDFFEELLSQSAEAM